MTLPPKLTTELIMISASAFQQLHKNATKLHACGHKNLLTFLVDLHYFCSEQFFESDCAYQEFMKEQTQHYLYTTLPTLSLSNSCTWTRRQFSREAVLSSSLNQTENPLTFCIRNNLDESYVFLLEEYKRLHNVNIPIFETAAWVTLDYNKFDKLKELIKLAPSIIKLKRQNRSIIEALIEANFTLPATLPNASLLSAEERDEYAKSKIQLLHLIHRCFKMGATLNNQTIIKLRTRFKDYTKNLEAERQAQILHYQTNYESANFDYNSHNAAYMNLSLIIDAIEAILDDFESLHCLSTQTGLQNAAPTLRMFR